MKTNIFYFSATGNSLNFAKSLAKEINVKNLIPISEIIENDAIYCDADRIGIICPVYGWGLPRIVTEFLGKLQIKGNPYIFSAVTCVGIPGKTLKNIQDLLRQKNQELHAGFVIQAPCSSLAKKNVFDNIIIGLDRKRKQLKTGKERLTEIATILSNLSIHKPETSSWPANYFGSFFHEYGVKYFTKAASDFKVQDQCTGCGTCVRVCPRANIIITDKKPEFLTNCEFCHACIQWCPKFAIVHPDFDMNLKQYRNPAIRMNEMVVNA